LKPSKFLSIIANSKNTFAGRKMGILVTNGVEDQVIDSLKNKLTSEKAHFEFVAPTVGGIVTKNGIKVPASQKILGGPSILYDAVAILTSSSETEKLLKNPAARQFIADAFIHCKFIGYLSAAKPLFEKAGILSELDEGCFELTDSGSIEKFITACRSLRYWPREKQIVM
jgi:catalase